MKSFTTLLFILLLLSALKGQESKRSNNWIIGYDLTDQDTFGTAIHLDFNSSPREIQLIKTTIGFRMEGSNTSMSDTSGNLLFYSDGCKIISKNGEIMKNGTVINPGIIQQYYCPEGGSPLRQGVMALPTPRNNNLFLLFNYDDDVLDSGPNDPIEAVTRRVFYHKIDMTKESGFGEVVEKNKIAIFDTIGGAGIQATRHANGIDWWIISSKYHSNCFFLTLVDSNEVHTPLIKCVGSVWNDVSDKRGQNVFSPNSKKYIRYDGWNQMTVYDFDNSTGDLSNPVFVHVSQDTTVKSVTGVSISPNSRFAYVSARKQVFQFDLEATDIEASKILIAEYDGFVNPFPTLFYMSALAPDGKIYISGTSSAKNLHVIHNPNCHGLSCNLVQHGIELPSFNFATIPNMPHYGFLNQECDTTSVKTENLTQNRIEIVGYPNPTTRYYSFQISEPFRTFGNLDILDISGKIIFSTSIETGRIAVDVDLANFADGLYFWQVTADGKRLANGKIVKMDR